MKMIIMVITNLFKICYMLGLTYTQILWMIIYTYNASCSIYHSLYI